MFGCGCVTLIEWSPLTARKKRTVMKFQVYVAVINPETNRGIYVRGLSSRNTSLDQIKERVKALNVFCIISRDDSHNEKTFCRFYPEFGFINGR